MSRFILYGTTFSLYTAKARSYLIKQGIEFEERIVGDPRYQTDILPKTGRQIIPVLQTPDGEVVQDGADIIDWFESRGLAKQSAYPKGPKQLVVAHILELFGGEGLLRPAMHYRWNFDETNLAFLEDQFGRFIFPTLNADERHAITTKAMGRMRQAGVAFGATTETKEAIERAYEEFLVRLNAHLMAVPYMLGGVPTIADYGMIAALFPHLGRDPYPATLMKRIAPAVYRWTERMQTERPDFPEFLDRAAALPENDEIPETLLPVLELVARDYLPEVIAFTDFTNDWLASQPDLKPGDVVGGDPKNRAIGMCAFDWQGVTINAVVLPYRTYLLQRAQDAFDKSDTVDQDGITALLDKVGLAKLISARTTRRVEREDNREVWGQ